MKTHFLYFTCKQNIRARSDAYMHAYNMHAYNMHAYIHTYAHSYTYYNIHLPFKKSYCHAIFEVIKALITQMNSLILF